MAHLVLLDQVRIRESSTDRSRNADRRRPNVGNRKRHRALTLRISRIVQVYALPWPYCLGSASVICTPSPCVERSGTLWDVLGR